MATDRWDRIEALFDEALELDADRIPEWLAGVDEDLRPQLERLLNAHRAADGFLEAPAAAAAAALVVGEGARNADGTQLGPYRILREIGRGGMGAVFLAHRDDLGMDVAVKRLAHSVASPRSVSAFLAERRTLARLDHPNIARLLDAGLAEGGQPYFVMEWVDGSSVTTFCDERRLDVGARLRLFLDVCAAAEYAHTRLVVHRDLKPSNVFVTREGTPKLLDFGIAKLLDEPGHQTATGTVGHFMTPQYAAPEQIRGEEIGISSDIYSLGALLYEILAGRPAHDGETGTPFEVGRRVLETEPLPLAEAAGEDVETAARRCVTPRRLRHHLQGDLATIVARAMHKDRNRRYSGCSALADDVRRHLEGRPVLARGDSWSYRTGRFVRCNWLPVGIGAAALVAAAAFAGFHTQRLAAERDRAQTQADTARGVSDFLVSVFLLSDPDQFDGQEPTVRDVLARGAERVQQDVQGDPVVRAQLLDSLGEVQRKLGRFEEAKPLLEEGLALRREAHGGRDPTIVQSLGHLAALRSDLEDWKGSVELNREAYQMAAAIHGEGHADAVVRLHNLGTSLRAAGNLEEAEQVLRASLEGRRRLFGDGHTAVANAVGSLANLVRDRGRYEEAADLYAEGLEMARAAHGDDHVRVGSLWHNLGRMHVRLQHFEEAERALAEALRIYQLVYGEDSPRLVLTLMTRGANRSDFSEHALAESDYAEALRLQRKHYGPGTARETNALTYLARARDALGRTDAAESTYAEALGPAGDAGGQKTREWAEAAWSHADFLNRHGRAVEALTWAEQAAEIAVASLGADHEDTQTAQTILAETRRALAGLDASGESEDAARRP